METHPLHIRLALAVYLAFPISLHTKRKLRDLLFKTFGKWFEHHPAYQQWRGHQNVVWQETEKLRQRYKHARHPKAPKEHDWYKIALLHKAQPPHEEPLIDVIIPVYKGYDETLRSIYNAVTAPNRIMAEIIVINDCSPDKQLTRMLKRLASMGLFTYLENQKNLGFVQTVNRGFALHPSRDLIILNADCVVYGNYADRLHEVAKSRPKVATVTPLTNNGELCSYPLQWHDNSWRNEQSDAELDGLCYRVNGAQSVEVPTGVGFCMYISRECMNVIGPFDAEQFGRGYGEENDFCLRAQAAGYVNLMAGGVFARHVGGSSFQSEKNKRVANAIRKLDKLHPGYRDMIEQWRANDPSTPMRIALDLARLPIKNIPSMLMVLHNWGGGTEKHVKDMARWLEDEDVQVFYMMPLENDCTRCQIGLFQKGEFQNIYTPNLRFSIATQAALLAQTLQQLNIKHIHINHMIGYDDAYFQGIQTLATTLHIAYDVTLHDYFSICPRTDLINENNIYCGEPDAAGCNRCLQKNGSPITRYKQQEPEIHAWRSLHLSMLQAARHIYVPNQDVRQRLEHYFPTLHFLVRPHPETLIRLPNVSDTKTASPIRKVALIGALYKLKGALLLNDLAKDAKERNLPLSFHIFGFYDESDTTLYHHGIIMETGRYKEKELPALMALSKPDVALFLSVWPETFSYTLSQAFQLGLYPVSFDIGAPADRIRDCGWGELLPLEFAGDVSKINDALVALTIPPQPEKLAVWDKSIYYPSLISDYYTLDAQLFEQQPIKQAI